MNTIFEPALVMMIVTMLVWLTMMVRRIRDANEKSIGIEEFTTPEKISTLVGIQASAASNCFRNMFEMPVLFYALCLIVAVSGIALEGSWYLYLAWVFVAARALQALVHCTSNNVMHRFVTYMISSLCVWAMAILLLIEII